ncbi:MULTISPECIES: TRAP transporter small permease subunit [unclassified Modicisalibacter]|uniref:TRAP transporter small permease subunit n=1 Tax=unclassified Modicisalibacter TaxID=2679913 RepID=UPI001CCD8174|nr:MULTISPECIES: TRAP transporter small permease subunit [unclassified Modicisalibacter]MBZ9559156.1 TRAP transporter small permease subunit [Modicisalibacter sp. R2A 31.J]MBZ9576679.1 TRAP transporter small permease subunit [Modicisalibacter sp. MOD 31.J]
MPHADLAPWRSRGGAVCEALARPLVGLGLWVGRVSSWLVLLVTLAVLTTVTLNALGINEIAEWQAPVVLFGKALTINSITELQWHLFGILTLLGGTYALHHDSHVRVDLVYQKLSPRGRAVIDILGHLVFLIPFCLLVAWLSKHFVMMSYLSGEHSNYGGLTDRYLIKAMLPIGLVFLALGALGQVLHNLAGLFDPRHLTPAHDTREEIHG